MTVSSQVKQTIASLKGAQATLETYSSIEVNRETKETLERNILRIGDTVKEMEKRLILLEFEEPQYKGF